MKELTLAERLDAAAASGLEMTITLSSDDAREIAAALKIRDTVAARVRALMEELWPQAVRAAADKLREDMDMARTLRDLRRAGRDRLFDRAMRVALYAMAAQALTASWTDLVLGVSP